MTENQIDPIANLAKSVVMPPPEVRRVLELMHDYPNPKGRFIRRRATRLAASLSELEPVPGLIPLHGPFKSIARGANPAQLAKQFPGPRQLHNHLAQQQAVEEAIKLSNAFFDAYPESLDWTKKINTGFEALNKAGGFKRDELAIPAALLPRPAHRKSGLLMEYALRKKIAFVNLELDPAETERVMRNAGLFVRSKGETND